MTIDNMLYLCSHCYNNYFKYSKSFLKTNNFLYPKRDSNSHDRSHWFLRPTRLPLRHRGRYHIVQAFYSQLRGIVSYLTRLTAVWVPEDMICSPAWTRTTNYCLEGSSYIPLTTGPKYLRWDLNPHGHFLSTRF